MKKFHVVQYDHPNVQKYTLDHPERRKILIVITVCQLKPLTFKKGLWRYYLPKIGQTIWLSQNKSIFFTHIKSYNWIHYFLFCYTQLWISPHLLSVIIIKQQFSISFLKYLVLFKFLKTNGKPQWCIIFLNCCFQKEVKKNKEMTSTHSTFSSLHNCIQRFTG